MAEQDDGNSAINKGLYSIHINLDEFSEKYHATHDKSSQKSFQSASSPVEPAFCCPVEPPTFVKFKGHDSATFREAYARTHPK